MARKLKYLTGEANELRQRQFKRHERQAAKVVGGVPTIGSGNKGMKGDAWGTEAGTRVMVEGKSTAGQSLAIKVAWLVKLVREAVAVGRAPRLHLRFESLPWPGKRDWVCLPEDDYQELCARAQSATSKEVPTGIAGTAP